MRWIVSVLLLTACTVPPDYGASHYHHSIAASAYRGVSGRNHSIPANKKSATSPEVGTVFANLGYQDKAEPHPLNCGTPEEFKICPLPDRPPIYTEQLPIITLDENGIPTVHIFLTPDDAIPSQAITPNE